MEHRTRRRKPANPSKSLTSGRAPQQRDDDDDDDDEDDDDDDPKPQATDPAVEGAQDLAQQVLGRFSEGERLGERKQPFDAADLVVGDRAGHGQR